jgi:Protein of unknown function (DUF2934)
MPARKSKPPVVVALRPEVSDELIAERAYFRWLSRECPITDGTEDWFAAKAELEREGRPPSSARRGQQTR